MGASCLGIAGEPANGLGGKGLMETGGKNGGFMWTALDGGLLLEMAIF